MIHKTVKYQYQQPTGSWDTVNNASNVSDQEVKLQVDALQKRYASLRVRAVDGHTGAIIDLR